MTLRPYTPVSSDEKQQAVIARICEAIADQRGDWSYATDCFCHLHSDHWSYQFDTKFLDGLERAVRNYVEEFERNLMMGDKE